MNKKKMKIVFLSSMNRYLEHELYIQLSKAMPDYFETIYFESDYLSNVTYKFSEIDDLKQKKDAFCEYIKIPPVLLDKRILYQYKDKLLRIISNYKTIYRWKRDFTTTICKINPDAIVFISPNEFNAKLACLIRKRIIKIFIQPSNIKKMPKKKRGILYNIKKIIFHKAMKLPLLSTSDTAFNKKGICYLFWSEIWVNHIKHKNPDYYYYVGAPKYDKYFQSCQQVKQIKPNGTVLIVLNKEMHVGYEKWNLFAEFYKKIMHSFPSFNFIVKAHPLGDWENSLNTFSSFNITKDPFDVKQACLVLTHWSTLCYESISTRIPTILINPGGKFDYAEFHLQNYSATVTNMEDFSITLSNFMSNNSKFPEYRKAFIKEQLLSGDGKSTERAISTIEKIIRQNQA